MFAAVFFLFYLFFMKDVCVCVCVREECTKHIRPAHRAEMGLVCVCVCVCLACFDGHFG